MNKKIDIIVKYYLPVMAGIEVNISETYKHLVKNGWDVTIHTSKDTYLEKDILPSDEVIHGIKIKRYSFKSDNFGFFPKIDWQTTGLVCLHNFNVYYFWILLYCLYLKVFGKKKFSLVLTPHGGFTPEWSIFSTIDRIKKYFYHYVVGTVLINLVVDGVRAVSKWEFKEIVKKGVWFKKVRVISNGLEDEAYQDIDRLASPTVKKQVKTFGRYIIQIGRIYPIKNIETTIKALANCPKDLHYILVGPIEKGHKYAGYKKELDELIDSLGLQNRVHFLGVVRGYDKYYLIKHAQIMVHMALWESFGNAIHEGISQGIPVIVANNTAMPLLISNGENGYCVDTKNDKKLAEKINFVLDPQNKVVINKIKNTNLINGKDNSWENVSSRMEKFYLDLIN